MKNKVLLFLLFLASFSFAQDLNYAHKIVDTLASPSMKGRGYVGNGNEIAAEFISNEFKKLRLKSFAKTYYQPFNTPVNIFPGTIEVRIDNRQLTPGVDYLADAGSPSLKGTFSTVHLELEDLLDEKLYTPKIKGAGKKVIVIEPYDKKELTKEEQKRADELIQFLKYSRENPAAATVICSSEKLTWTTSSDQFPKPSITIKTDSTYRSFETVTINIESKFIKKYQSKNVVGFIEGKRTDSIIVLTAHYDHLGMMGNTTIFPGANDNASGIAMLLNVAKYYSEKKPEFSIAFIAFGGEEIGLVGSKYFTENPLFELSKIKFLINFDLAGTGDEGIQVVNGSIYKKEFDLLTKINEEEQLLPAVKIRGEACNSDHCFFHMKKIPCFFIYTLGGIKAYHDVYDKPETLPLTEFEDYFKLLVRFIDKL